MPGWTAMEDQAFACMREAMASYARISDDTWSTLCRSCTFRTLIKGQVLYPPGRTPTSFSFVYSGLFRVFSTDAQGKEYNKNFFEERTFPGTMAALITSTPSQAGIEALENSQIVEIDFAAYRRLLEQAHDLALFQIAYLEKNWLLAKDAREIQLVMEDASERYRRFLEEFPSLSARLPQYHIASHLGITPTQLSRIRRSQQIDQPM